MERASRRRKSSRRMVSFTPSMRSFCPRTGNWWQPLPEDRLSRSTLVHPEGPRRGPSPFLSPAVRAPWAGLVAAESLEVRHSTDARRSPRMIAGMMLCDVLTTHRAELIDRCRAKVARRSASNAGDVELQGISVFLEQLIKALRVQPTAAPMRSRTVPSQTGGDAMYSEIGATAAR